MRFYRLQISNFRRIQQTTILFGDATFLIGPNNSGKSSVLRAIDLLLSGKPQAPIDDFFAIIDPETGEQIVEDAPIVLEAEFRNVPTEAIDWRGFRGRVFEYVTRDENETGLSIIYRRTFAMGQKARFEMLSKKRVLKSEFKDAQTLQGLVDAGLPEAFFRGAFPDLTQKLNKKEREFLEDINEVWDLKDEDEWVQNPGGIPGNVLSRLPEFLLIPAEPNSADIDDKSGALNKTLNSLFSLVREVSPNYKKAQEFLNELSRELDPTDEKSEFGKMMNGLNEVLGSVFPETSIYATADLTDPDTSLKPQFEVSMKSNVTTPVNYQGTGIVRSAIFALLRYRQRWVATQEGKEGRGLIIGFEEPEIYLHPSAANQMRDTIYELTKSSSQIIATTHSPYLIDLSRRPRQVLNRMHTDDGTAIAMAFSVSDKFMQLHTDDKSLVKMVLKLDSHIARIFFAKQVVVVEGDTEDIAIRRYLDALSIHNREKYLLIQRDFEVIKARGKAAIIGLAKYLNSLGVNYKVIHDKDTGVAGAEKMNQPIQTAVGDVARVFVLQNCVEDILGYQPPSSEKPYRAYVFSEGWAEDFNSIPQGFHELMRNVFHGYI